MIIFWVHIFYPVGLLTLKIKAKYSFFIIALLMVLVLDTVMSFTMTSVFVGWTPVFIQRFAGAWLIGFAVALPTSLAITPLIRRLVKLVCE
jgi:hypothetical protein